MTFDAGSIEASLDLDRTPFQNGLKLARKEAEAFRVWANQTLKVKVDVDGGKAAAELAALRAEADKTTRSVKKVGEEGGASFHAILDSALLLGPALIPIAGGLAGISSGLVGVGLVGGLAFGGFKKDLASTSREGITLKGQIAGLGAGLNTLEKTAERGVLGSFNHMVDRLNAELPQLNQFIEQISPKVGDLLDHLLGAGIGLLNSMMPLITQAVGGIDQLATRLEHWATGPAGEKFFAHLGDDIPMAVEAVGNLADILFRLIAAAEPFGEVVLTAINGLTNALDAIPIPVLTAIVSGLIVWRMQALLAAAANKLLAASAGEAAAAGAAEGAAGGAAAAGGLRGFLGGALARVAAPAAIFLGLSLGARALTKDLDATTAGSNGLKQSLYELGHFEFKNFAKGLFGDDPHGKLFKEWQNQLKDVRNTLKEIDKEGAARQDFHMSVMTGPAPDASSLNAFNTARAKEYAADVNGVTQALRLMNSEIKSAPISEASHDWQVLQHSIQKSVDPIDAFLKAGGKTVETYHGIAISQGAYTAAIDANTKAGMSNAQIQAAAEGQLHGMIDALGHNRAEINKLIVEQARLATATAEVEDKYGLTAGQVDVFSKALGINANEIALNNRTAAAWVHILGSVKSAFENGDSTMQAWLGTLGQLDLTTDSLSNRVAILGAGLTALRGNTLSMATTNLGAVSAAEQLSTAIHDNAKSIDSNGHLLGQLVEVNGRWLVQQPQLTAGSVAIAQAMSGAADQAVSLAQSIYQNTRDAGLARSAYDGLRQQFIDTATQMTGSRKEAEGLANQIFAIPKDSKTFVELLGKNDVSGAVAALTKQLGKFSDRLWKALVALDPRSYGDTNNNLDTINKKLRYFEGTHTATFNTIVRQSPLGTPNPAAGGADGMYVTQGTGPRADDVVVRVSKGEYIVNAEATKKNFHLIDSINKGVKGFADGGSPSLYVPPAPAASTGPSATSFTSFLNMITDDLNQLGALAHASSSSVHSALANITNDVRKLADNKLVSSSLVTALTNENNQLTKVVQDREKVVAHLNAVKNDLKSVQADMANITASVRDAVIGGFDVGTSGNGYAYGIQASLDQQLKDAQKFAALRKQAQALGLDPRLLQQITAEGPAQAGKNLAAIVGGGKDYIATLNSTYSQLYATGTAVGAAQAKDIDGSKLAHDIKAMRDLTARARHDQAVANKELAAIRSQLAAIEHTLLVEARRA